MRVHRAFRLSVVAVVAALALAGCMRRQGPVAVAQPRSDLDALAYGQPAYAAAPSQRGLLTASSSSSGGALAALRSGIAAGRPASSPANAYASAGPIYAAAQPVVYDPQYRLDAGDKLRVVVYGQEGLTNTYAIDASGAITMPLIGAVPARGHTAAGLAAEISGRLRNGFIREPSVAVEVESYRPFFILGEVAAPGQYPYVPHMTVESAIAIAGGFSPRARRDRVMLTHPQGPGALRAAVPLGTFISPGDTIMVGERWF